MSGSRWRLLAVIGVISVLLAMFLRDAIYDLVVVPLAYFLWIARFYYLAIPQWMLWIVLLVVIFVAVAWNLVPEVKASSPEERRRERSEGQVEALAVWIRKARQGYYFKWQLANRFGQIARRLDESDDRRAELVSGHPAVEQYFDAGLNHSFVDYPTPSNRFQKRKPTPLDVDPRVVADYLESQMEKDHDGRPRSL
jgi:hypothetical protein